MTIVQASRKLQFAYRECAASERRVRAANDQFSAVMRAERKRRKITLGEMSKATAIARTTLSYLEHGKRWWTVKQAQAVEPLLRRMT